MDDSNHLLQPAGSYRTETRSQSCDFVNDMARMIPTHMGFRSAKVAVDAGRRVRWTLRRVAIKDHWLVVTHKLFFLTIATLVLFLWTRIDQLNPCKKHMLIAVIAFEVGANEPSSRIISTPTNLCTLSKHVFRFYCGTSPLLALVQWQKGRFNER
jgi:hypothetical protein